MVLTNVVQTSQRMLSRRASSCTIDIKEVSGLSLTVIEVFKIESAGHIRLCQLYNLCTGGMAENGV